MRGVKAVGGKDFTVDTTKQHDWGLIVAGVLLILLAAFFVLAPGLTLATIALIAGAGFLVSGVFDICSMRATAASWGFRVGRLPMPCSTW